MSWQSVILGSSSISSLENGTWSVLRHSSARPSWIRRSGAEYSGTACTRRLLLRGKTGTFRLRFGGRDCLCQWDEYPELDIDGWVESKDLDVFYTWQQGYCAHGIFWQLLEGRRVELLAIVYLSFASTRGFIRSNKMPLFASRGTHSGNINPRYWNVNRRAWWDKVVV